MIAHRKIVQAKHIPDDLILRTVEDLCREADSWTNTWAVAERMPAIPHKVVLAKLSRLLNKGYVTGCDCGCRGDWELTDRGRELARIDGPVAREPDAGCPNRMSTAHNSKDCGSPPHGDSRGLPENDGPARREAAIQDMIARGYTRERAIELIDLTLGAFFRRWDAA